MAKQIIDDEKNVEISNVLPEIVEQEYSKKDRNKASSTLFQTDPRSAKVIRISIIPKTSTQFAVVSVNENHERIQKIVNQGEAITISKKTGIKINYD